MEHQIFDLLVARFDRLDEGQARLHQVIEDHTKMDEKYWKKLDAQEAQVSILKWLFSAIGSSGVIAWLYSLFGKHH